MVCELDLIFLEKEKIANTRGPGVTNQTMWGISLSSDLWATALSSELGSTHLTGDLLPWPVEALFKPLWHSWSPTASLNLKGEPVIQGPKQKEQWEKTITSTSSDEKCLQLLTDKQPFSIGHQNLLCQRNKCTHKHTPNIYLPRNYNLCLLHLHYV